MDTMLPTGVIEAIMRLAVAASQQTMTKRPIARISLAADFGLACGIAPSTSIDVHTPAGPVEVYCEPVPRSYGVIRIE